MAQEAVNLKKVLTRTDLMSHAIGSVIGAGIFSTLPIAIGMTGRSAALAFILAAVIIIISLVPRILVNGSVRLNGGTYAHLGLFGYKRLAGAFIIISIIANISISWYAITFAQYFSSLVPGVSIKFIAGACLTLFTITNLIGIKEASRLQNLMVLILAISLSMFCLFGVFHIQPGFFEPQSFITNGPMGVLTAAGMLTFACSGADGIIPLSPEAKNPTKDIPWCIIVSTLAVAGLYAIMAIVASGVFPLSVVVNQPLSLVASKILPGPLYIFFIVGGACFALVTSLNSQIGWVTKPILKACNDGWFPKFFGHVNEKFKTPHNLIIALYILGMLPIVTGVDLDFIAGTSVFTNRFTDFMIATTIISIPKVIPEEWKISRYHISDLKLKAFAVLAIITSLFASYLTLRGLSRNAVIINLGMLACALLFGVLRMKSGKIHMDILYEKAE
ncbi:amino acid permease [Fusobacterium varium]|jgi:APA family basic amino acid/polyamine antiporter|uniref:APC family permease n=5 Tax=Fusobacterium TaxID=848 RepID=UPI000E4EC21B|nr:APC family permease [Fusobacterium varium]RHG35914.1 amino acid permease [Fusobacterium varium]